MRFYKVSKRFTDSWTMCQECLDKECNDLTDEGKFIHYCWRPTFEKEVKICSSCGRSEGL